MSNVALLAKVYHNSQLKHVDRFLESTLAGLKVETKTCGATSRGWVQIMVSGEDEGVALHYLADEVGLCPTRLENLGRFAGIEGRIASLNKSKGELYVDIGVFEPSIVDAVVPLNHLQSVLADGRKVGLAAMAELFGFCESLPLSVKILSVDREKNHVEAMLSERQLVRYRNWTESLLDRLIIIGLPRYEVTQVLERAGLNRDVPSIERLGLFEHAVVCKLGTDAAGLVTRIGKKLPMASFKVFNPKRVLGFLDPSMFIS
jgi:hypothetical protein